MNSYCYFDTLKPVLNIYDTKIKSNSTEVYCKFNLISQGNSVILFLDSMPKNLDPFSIKIIENGSVIINGINSVIVNPRPITRTDIIAEIIAIQEEISNIGEEISKFKLCESTIVKEYKAKFSEADSYGRIQLLEKSNYKIQELRLLANSKKQERETLESEIDLLLNKINGLKQDAFQKIYIQLNNMLVNETEIKIVYELKKSNKHLPDVIANNNIINQQYQLKGYWLIGQLSDSKSNKYLTNARVNVYYLGQLIAQSQTDFDGQFKFELLEEGIYQILISKPGYKTRTERDIIVKIDKPSRLQLELKKANKINAFEFMTLALPMVEIVKDVVK
jgi:hypothetical protein